MYMDCMIELRLEQALEALNYRGFAASAADINNAVIDIRDGWISFTDAENTRWTVDTSGCFRSLLPSSCAAWSDWYESVPACQPAVDLPVRPSR